MQKEFISLSATADAVPDAVRAVVDAIALVSARLTAQVTPQGSIASEPLREILAPVLSRFGITPGVQAGFASKEVHFSGTDLRTGVSVQAGRAFVNNAALVSVLASASSPHLDWVIVVVPEVYKSSKVYPRVLDQLHELQGAHGVHLDLQGVVLLSY